MSSEQKTPIGEEKWRRPEKPEAPALEPEAPVSTGDMQEVGATEPEEVEERRKKTDGEAPVHENPGDQNSG